jgi:tRNA A-37 threonylcarbamoyl transferase component Bud32
MPDPDPDQVAGYRIESQISRGGMGVVYLARQAFPERRVALKLLSPELAEDPDFRERFVRESNAAASTEHPNIVPIYGAGEADGRLFLAMRYVDGTDLGTLIRTKGRLDPERAVSICIQIAAALDAAHARGLVHRDVKPGNVLIDAGGHAYLTDFGLITRNEIDTGVTKTGQFMGSTAYCAPEQIKGEPVDARTDVYSLGCVLYECLTGEPPFPRASEAATLYAHLEERPPVPTAKRPELPPPVDAVVAKAMAKRPEDRYASAGEMAAEARASVAGRGEVVSPSTKPRWPLAAGVGIVVLAVAILAFFILPTGGRTAGPSRSAAPGVILRSGLLAFDPTTHAVSRTVALDYPPTGLFGACFHCVPPVVPGVGAIWTLADGVLWRVDATTAEAQQIDVPVCAPTSISAVGIATGAVWLLCSARPPRNQQIVVHVDPFTHRERVVRTGVPSRGAGVGLSPGDVAASQATVWVNPGDGSIEDVDATGIARAGSVVGVTADEFVAGEGKLWVANKLASTITPVSLASGRSGLPIPFNGSIDAIAAGDGGLWILDRTAGTVTEIDATTLSARPPVGVGSAASSIAVGFGAVWLTDPARRSLTEVDPVTSQTHTFDVNASAVNLVADRQTGKLWLVVAPT